MNKQAKVPLKERENSLQNLISLELPWEEMKSIKGGSADGHDLVAPAFELEVYSDGAPPPDR